MAHRAEQEVAEQLADRQQHQLDAEPVGTADRRGQSPDHDGQDDELGRGGAGWGAAARSGVRGGGQSRGQRAGSQPPQWVRG